MATRERDAWRFACKAFRRPTAAFQEDSCSVQTFPCRGVKERLQLSRNIPQALWKSKVYSNSPSSTSDSQKSCGLAPSGSNAMCVDDSKAISSVTTSMKHDGI